MQPVWNTWTTQWALCTLSPFDHLECGLNATLAPSTWTKYSLLTWGWEITCMVCKKIKMKHFDTEKSFKANSCSFNYNCFIKVLAPVMNLALPLGFTRGLFHPELRRFTFKKAALLIFYLEPIIKCTAFRSKPFIGHQGQKNASTCYKMQMDQWQLDCIIYSSDVSQHWIKLSTFLSLNIFISPTSVNEQTDLWLQ